MNPPSWTASLAVDSRCELGEGPQWHAAMGRLYWCDIINARLHWLEVASGATGHHELDHRVSLAEQPLAGGLFVAEAGIRGLTEPPLRLG